MQTVGNYVFVDLRDQDVLPAETRTRLLKQFYDDFLLVYFPMKDEVRLSGNTKLMACLIALHVVDFRLARPIRSLSSDADSRL
jgi:hypothetical protein